MKDITLVSFLTRRVSSYKLTIDWETSNTNDLGPDYWEFIWNIVTDELDGLENLDWRIQELVILDIRETWELSDFVRKLEMEDEANGSDVLKGLTMCRCCIL